MNAEEAKVASEAYKKYFFVATCKNVLEDAGIFVKSLKDVEVVVDASSTLSNEWLERPYYSERNSLDTYVREELYDTLSMVYLGMVWPIYGDSKEYSVHFSKALSKLIEEREWFKK